MARPCEFYLIHIQIHIHVHTYTHSEDSSPETGAEGYDWGGRKRGEEGQETPEDL